MQIGRLNRRIEIQSQTTAQDSFGQVIQTWALVYTTWASIDVQNSQLVYAPAEFAAKTIIRITFRWTSSVVIKPNMRISYTEATTGVVHTYEIEALINDRQRNRQIMALCYELDSSE
jgi:SPP1 family predicted phage head-tail adaptor